MLAAKDKPAWRWLERGRTACAMLLFQTVARTSIVPGPGTRIENLIFPRGGRVDVR